MPNLFYAGQPDYIEKLNTLATAASMTNGTVAASFLSLAVTGTATAASFVGPLTGNASTATTLATARNINGVAFNGSADITVTAAAGTLTGTTLAANVVNASLNSITPTGGTLDVNGIVEAESYKIGGEFVVRAQPVAGNYFLGRSGNLTNTGSGNTGVGDLALSALTTGVDHTAVGSGALQNITGAVGNTAVGRLALNVATTATNNTALGDSCLRQTTTGNLNVAVGYATMDANTTGQYNTAVGAGPLRANTTGESNVAIGRSAMFLNTTSSLNTAVGDLALYFCNAGEGTAVGALSLYQATARRNTAIGTYAGFAITSGESNTFIGYDCGNTSQTATVSRSIAIGNGAFTTADDQCVIGGSNITETKLRNVSVTGSISATSLVDISAAGAGQIKFPATQNASADANTLDDYQEATYTGTATGMTTSPTGTVSYTLTGNEATLNLPEITGTSNATTFTVTGMPAEARPATRKTVLGRAQDNGGAIVPVRIDIETTGVLTIYANADAGAFTSSGTKTLAECSVTYTRV